MQTQTKIFIGIGVLILIFIGYGASQNNNSSESMNSTSHSGTVATQEMSETVDQIDPPSMEIEAGESSDDTMGAMDDESEMMDDTHQSPEPMTEVSKSGKYLTYSPEAVVNSEAENIVLSFSATWCPSCRTLDKDINASLSDIPAGTEIFKVDYDTNTELRKKYGVTTQHTQVVVDKDGNLIKKWVGSNTLEQFLAKI